MLSSLTWISHLWRFSPQPARGFDPELLARPTPTPTPTHAEIPLFLLIVF